MIYILRLVLGAFIIVGVTIASSACDLKQNFPSTLIRSQEVSNVSGEMSPSGSKHPGQIFFEDQIEGRQWTQLATEVPQTLAWVEVGQDWQPVIRIEITGIAEQRRISKFAQDGSLLESTIQARRLD